MSIIHSRYVMLIVFPSTIQALYDAAERGDIEGCKCIIAKGADINWKQPGCDEVSEIRPCIL